jgi:hypothetical protein
VIDVVVRPGLAPSIDRNYSSREGGTGMEERPSEDRAIFALIAGIVALMFTWFHRGGPLSIISVPAAVTAVAMGVSALRRGTARTGLATAGAVLGTIALCSWVLIKSFALVF